MQPKQSSTQKQRVKAKHKSSANLKSKQEPQVFWQTVTAIALFELKHRRRIIDASFYSKE
jgi:hypothetical protein